MTVPSLLLVKAKLLQLTMAALTTVGAANASPVHDTHLSHARVVVEGSVVVARIRLFRDDVTRALKHPVGDDSTSKRLLSAYLNRTFGVRADNVALTAELLDGAADVEGDQPVWQVLVQWKAARPVTRLALRDQLLFETFSDQQNVAVVIAQPSDRRQTLYFHAGDRSEQVVTF